MRRDVQARARRVRLLVMDVDGVLTDGRMIVSERGDEAKSFHVRDGVALTLAARAGLRTAFVTGESTTIAKARGERLGVDVVVLGARRKGEAVDALLERFGVAPAELAYVGDDLLDLPALARAGLAVAVRDAAPEVRAIAHLVTRARGGHGVARECVELILRAQNRWTTTLAEFVREHDRAVPRRRARSSRRARS